MDIYERKEAEVPDKRTAKMLYQSGDAPTVWGGMLVFKKVTSQLMSKMSWQQNRIAFAYTFLLTGECLSNRRQP